MTHSERLALSRLQVLARVSPATAHDARGALNAISLHHALLAASLGKEGPDQLERQRHWLRVAETERERLKCILDPLFGQLAARAPGRAVFDPNAPIVTVTDLLRPYAARHRVRLVATSLPHAPSVAGSRDLVEQVVCDLVLLAVDATERPGTVALSVAERPGGACIALRAADVPGAKADAAVLTATSMWSEMMPPDGTAFRLEAATGTGLAVDLELPAPAGVERARSA